MGLVSCNSQKIQLNSLKNCLDKKDISTLEKGLLNFETLLAEKYTKLQKEESYIQFLNDFSNYKISPDFFLDSDSKKIRAEIRGFGIWQFFEESDEEMEAEIRLDGSQSENSLEILTLKSEFQNCLITEVSSKGIKNALEIRTKVPNLSLGLTAKSIHDGINKGDLKNAMDRLVIAYVIYYEFALNLEK